MSKKNASDFSPLGKWIAVTTDKKGKETSTKEGIIYTEKETGQYVKSTVEMVGPGVEVDIKPGDVIYWDSKKYEKNEVDGMQIVHEDWVAVVLIED